VSPQIEKKEKTKEVTGTRVEKKIDARKGKELGINPHYTVTETLTYRFKIKGLNGPIMKGKGGKGSQHLLEI